MTCLEAFLRWEAGSHQHSSNLQPFFLHKLLKLATIELRILLPSLPPAPSCHEEGHEATGRHMGSLGLTKNAKSIPTI